MPKKSTKQGANAKSLASQIDNLTKRMEKMASQPSKKRKRNRGASSNQPIPTESFLPGNVGNMIASKASDTGLRRLRVTPRTGLSDQGIGFLKCAFAPPDFQQNTVAGVPDDYRGPSLTRKHRYVSNLNVATGADIYILLLPTPGYAYWIATTAPNIAPTAALQWTGVPYADFQSMFGSVQTSNNSIVTKFRFVSNHIEVIPTVNQMIWSGTIQSWKIPVVTEIRQSGAGLNDLIGISGLDGTTGSSLSSQYTGPFIMGLYTACYNSNPTFEFQPTSDQVVLIPATVGPSDFGQIVSPVVGGSALGIPGLDSNFESMVIRISGVTANETAIVKTWACVEYQIGPNNALYEFQSMSPCDKLAMELYREIIQNLPIGVPFEDNESFWKRVLQIVHMLTGAGSVLPGPYGAISRGANLISGALLPFSN